MTSKELVALIIERDVKHARKLTRPSEWSNTDVGNHLFNEARELRFELGVENRAGVLEELADVLCVAEHIRIRYDFAESEVDAEMRRKLVLRFAFAEALSPAELSHFLSTGDAVGVEHSLAAVVHGAVNEAEADGSPVVRP